MSIAEIQKMSNRERIEAMENLWNSLSHSPKSVDSPDWHADVLDSRTKHIESGKAKFLTLDQVKTHFS